MPYQPILATLGYVLDRATGRVLMIHRGGRPGDVHEGKYNGLGGKLEDGEDVVAGMVREVREEAGIEATSLRLRGTVNWPGFGKDGEDWFGFIFLIDGWTGDVPAANAEGQLEWVPLDQVPSLPMWEGDRHFLPLVFGDDGRQFHGVMPYRDGRPERWAFAWVTS